MAEEKKGLPIWAWFGIGCAGLIVLVMVAMLAVGFFVTKKVKDVAGDFENNPEIAAARLLVKLNPDYEEVSVDEDEGTITVRDKKTGKVFTADVEDLKEGRFTISGEDGTTVVTTETDEDEGTFTISTGDKKIQIGAGGDSSAPEWVPVPEDAETQGLFSMSEEDSVRGSLKILTDEDPKDVLAFYRSAMDEAGFEVQTSSYSGGGESVEMLTGNLADPKRTLMVNVTTGSDDEINIVVTYSEGD